MFYFLFSQGNISRNTVFCESPGISVSPCLSPLLALCFETPSLGPHPQLHKEFKNHYKGTLLEAGACYLADPRGTGLLPLRFWVLEAAELGALRRQGLGKRALLSISVIPQAPSSPNHCPRRGRRWPEGWGGREEQRDLNTACSISPVLRPFRVAFRSGIEKGALVAGPAGSRLRAGRRVPGPPLGLGWGGGVRRAGGGVPGQAVRPPTLPPASVPPGEAGAGRRARTRTRPRPHVCPQPPPRLLCVAVKRLSINPVWTVEREHKGCLLSG